MLGRPRSAARVTSRTVPRSSGRTITTSGLALADAAKPSGHQPAAALPSEINAYLSWSFSEQWVGVVIPGLSFPHHDLRVHTCLRGLFQYPRCWREPLPPLLRLLPLMASAAKREMRATMWKRRSVVSRPKVVGHPVPPPPVHALGRCSITAGIQPACHLTGGCKPYHWLLISSDAPVP
ncbi:hypothetical protein HPB48_011753 [Haemaphysalis longicornis]|uniref:Uncharacterized protein n=1 Tax=Haemaphysalis longicornis TaxID=44386 RepID=A0A9J6H0R7_HAELO|nr:hypothetical protein HPB48_011753 [Haemaphysalis longicornis]